jgi:uncharacterized protein YhbP (UPF0306 family)
MKKTDKALLLDYLKKHKLMTIATYSGKLGKPWVATAFYIVDGDLSLYFLTSPKTEHGQHMVENKYVACNIADTHQEVTDKKIGVQIQGTVSRVNAVLRIKWMFKMWHKINPGTEERLNYKNLKNKVISARVYKITPAKIKFFNEELYPSEESKTFYL